MTLVKQDIYSNSIKVFILSLLIVGFAIAISIPILDSFLPYKDNKDNKENKPNNHLSYIPNSPKLSLPCELIFDIYRHKICLDVPYYYYQNDNNNPSISFTVQRFLKSSFPVKGYEKEQIYFNIIPQINYSKITSCTIDDYILRINKLDKRFISAFWLITY
jgi:hypothetical protein